MLRENLMGKKLIQISIAINFLGAFLTFFYFNYVNPDLHGDSGISRTQAYLILAIGTGIIFTIFLVLFRKWANVMLGVADNEMSIDDLDILSANRVKRQAIQFPVYYAIFTFMAWILAGFIFGFIEPVF